MELTQKKSLADVLGVSRTPQAVPTSNVAPRRESAPDAMVFARKPGEPKTVIVHDWLPVYAGAERVLEQMLRVFPHADLFSLIDLIPPGQRDFLLNKPVQTSALQKWDWARNHYRSFLAVMPLAVEQFDLSSYELILSSNYAVAKGVLTSASQLHLCYCHSPMRYAWDLQHQYLRETGLDRGVRSVLARILLHYLRTWDYQSSRRVDHFFANSRFVADRIRKFYGRRAEVLHPPVDTSLFELCAGKKEHYVTVSRLVPYKMVNLIVEAFNAMPDRQLHVVGDGPDYQKIKDLAGPNVTMMGFQSNEVVRRELQEAKAFVFAAEEDFGIVSVEAQACGTPVIAYGKGGSYETIIDGETGVFFDTQDVPSLTDAVERFEAHAESFIPEVIRRHAEQFSAERFRNRFEQQVMQRWTKFQGRHRGAPPSALSPKAP